MDTDQLAFSECDEKTTRNRVIIGIDFGSTLGTVAYTVLRQGESEDSITSANVRTISGYPANHRGRYDQEEAPMMIFYECPPTQETDGIWWGFKVKDELECHTGPVHTYEEKFISCPKLLFDESQVTAPIRAALNAKLAFLNANGFNLKAEDVVENLLSRWLCEVKNILLESNVVTSTDRPEFAICLPTHWFVTSHHKLLEAMGSAIRASWPVFNTTTASGSVFPVEMFSVREPEAGANGQFGQRGSHHIRKGEIILIVDAGGITVEATAYRILSSQPLRFEEVSQTSTDICGSNLINIAFKDQTVERLQSETYLYKDRDGVTLSSLVHAKVLPRFDTFTKRKINLMDPSSCEDKYCIDGLKPNKEIHFKSETLLVNSAHLHAVIYPVLAKVDKLLDDQFRQVESNKLQISSVSLTGGFSDSKFLQDHVKGWLQASKKSAVWIDPAPSPGPAIARGAVLRALNKKDGPARFVRSSFGILRHQQVPHSRNTRQNKRDLRDNPNLYHSLKSAEVGHDGNTYVFDCLSWFIQKGDILEPGKPFTFYSHHVFKEEHEKWEAEEIIYHAPTKMESDFPLDHEKNAAAMEIGHIDLHMTSLKEQAKISPKRTSEGKIYYNVVVKIIIILSTQFLHTIHCHGEWSPDIQKGIENDIDIQQSIKNPMEDFAGDDVLKSDKAVINITAHFQPSTF